MGKDERFDYLDEERIKLWDKILEIEKDVKLKTSDYESKAKASSITAAQIVQEIDDKLVDINSYWKNITDKNQQANSNANKIENIKADVTLIQGDINSKSGKIDLILNDLNVKKETVEETVKRIDEIVNTKVELEKKVSEINSLYEKAVTDENKINVLLQNVNSIKLQIDKTHIDFYGYTNTNEEGEVVKIDGVIDKLQKSNEELDSNIKTSKKEINEFIQYTRNNTDEFFVKSKSDFEGRIKDWGDTFNSLKTQIDNLLPNAMTAGLSSAYSAKKEAEVTELNKQTRAFKQGLVGLVLVSLIPFSVSINSLLQGTSLEQVVLRIPRIAVAIFPLYIPVLWLAYSSNRKMNLAKRLIEEYTHKEVLSKTFEGLSTQIKEIKDTKISEELRIKLLYNILEVNSENPGKLISDYNKSDHPLMDALDKSVKLTNSITKLADTPGMKKLAEILSKKRDKINKEYDEKATKGLEINEDDDNENSNAK